MTSTERHRKILKMYKGEELKVYVSRDLCEESSFMRNAYQQALRAVAGIVERTRNFHKHRNDSDYEEEEALISFGSNVIAFSAQRGCGKTSTMLSFSWMLEGLDGKALSDTNHRFLSSKDREYLENAQFHILAPISPSVMEEQQNILYVVLARLYDYALKLVNDCARPCRYDRGRSTSDQIGELKRKLQECYSAIVGVKQKTDHMPRDILELQDIRDGLALCKRFFALVNQITDCLGGDANYLVLQLDDADSQIQNGFGALEDVRKYLQIPNLIVLMSADVELIQDLVRQDFEKYFPAREADDAFRKRLIRTCRKYIDKLIPPTHLVSLPQLDACIDQYSDQLILQYYEKEGDKTPMYLVGGDMALQDMLLQLIFQKTGIIFVKPDNYVHSIVPTTLRGLHQMMKMLTDMKDIPLIDSPDCFQDPMGLAEILRQQIITQEYNLSQFSDYFSNDWIYVKVTDQKDRDFLVSLRDANGEFYIPLAIDYLCERYEIKERPPVYNSVRLDSLMYLLQTQHTSQEDTYLLFSIRTLFSLKHHKMILARKYAALNRFVKEPDSFFAVDYDPDKLHLSKSYLINDSFLSISMGTAQSIAMADSDHRAREQEKEQLKRELDKAEKSVSAEEANIQKLYAQLDKVRNGLEKAQKTEKTALNNLQIAQAELDAIGGVEPGGSGKQAALVSNAKKAVARYQVLQKNAIMDESSLKGELQIIQSSVTRAEKRYQRKLSLQEEIYDAWIACDDGTEAYKRAIGVYRGKADSAEPVSLEVRPEFVVRNALYDAWSFQRRVDQKNMTTGRFAWKELLRECMVGKDANGNDSVSFMNFIAFLLRLGADDLRSIRPSAMPKDTQQVLYYTQECAVAIAANWEVQDLIYRKMRGDYSMQEDSFDQETSLEYNKPQKGAEAWLDFFYEKIDGILKNQMNNGNIFSYVSNRAAKPESGYGREVSCWSILAGYDLLTGKKYLSQFVDFEGTLYELFDLPLRLPEGFLPGAGGEDTNAKMPRQPKKPDDLVE